MDSRPVPRRLVPLVLLLVLFLSGGAPASAQELRFSTGEWAPYTSKALPSFGAAAEIVAAAAKAAGFESRFYFYPWKRAEQLVQDGTVFGSFPYFFLPERAARPEVYRHSEPLFSSVYGILYRVGASPSRAGLSFTHPEDLRPFTIGVLSGTPFVTTVLDQAGVRYEETADLAATIRKLAIGREDYVVEDRAVAWAAVKEAFPDKLGDFAFLPRNFSERRSVHLLVSAAYPGSQVLLDRFNAGLRAIKADGTLKRIYDRYGLVP